MRIGPFGHWEIILILIVVLLLFGAKRLPDMARGIGRSIREFRGAIRGDGEDEHVAEAKRPRSDAPKPASEPGDGA